MSKTNTWILVTVLVVAVCAVFMVPTWNGGDEASAQKEITNLDEWVELCKRPDFTLLDKVDLDEYFVTVYRTEANEIALCYRWKAGDDMPNTSFAVSDPAGRPLRDASREEETTPLNTLGSIPKHALINGMVIPIPQDYVGTARVMFKDNHGNPDAIAAREVYTKTFDLVK